jgi:hypothetical protein
MNHISNTKFERNPFHSFRSTRMIGVQKDAVILPSLFKEIMMFKFFGCAVVYTGS